MRSLPFLLRTLLWGASGFGLSLYAQTPSGAQSSAPVAAGPAPMQAYTITIPHTDVKFDMVPIPGGRFRMGSPVTEKGRHPDEGPVREVEIEPFWMGKTEVTWDEYLLFMHKKKEDKKRDGKRPAPFSYGEVDAVSRPTEPYMDMDFGMGKQGFPAISMTQHAANKYCEWLSASTGQFFRLPTEAEWEYAARAGTTTAYFWGDDPERIGEYCWSGKNSDFKYQKVGTKKPNPWGLHDILGNVVEWTLDQYVPTYEAGDLVKSPWVKATKPYPHSIRGGSWDDDNVAKLRCAARSGSTPDWKLQDPQIPKSVWYFTDAQFLGFRIIRPLKVPSEEAMKAYWNSGVEKD